MTTGQKKILFVPALATLLIGCQSVDESKLERHEFARIEMGMKITMTLYAEDPGQARLAAKTAFDRIRSLNLILSDYEDDSELNRVRHRSGSSRWIRLSPELWTVMKRADELARQTDGAFDITAGPLIQLWKRARRQRALPDPERLAEAKTRVGHFYIDFDSRNRSVNLWQKDMRLDLGGIAKGFAMDEAMKVLRQEGIGRALITGGGDMVASDPPPGRPGWKIELPQSDTNSPPQFVRLSRGAFATSGDRYQSVILDGRRYSHIVDPRTGLGLTDRSLIYIIARDGMTADSLATATSVLKGDEALALAQKHRAELRIRREHEGKTKVRSSPGFDRYLWE
jgi:FAD:protein FMN transferase